MNNYQCVDCNDNRRWDQSVIKIFRTNKMREISCIKKFSTNWTTRIRLCDAYCQRKGTRTRHNISRKWNIMSRCISIYRNIRKIRVTVSVFINHYTNVSLIPMVANWDEEWNRTKEASLRGCDPRRERTRPVGQQDKEWRVYKENLLARSAWGRTMAKFPANSL